MRRVIAIVVLLALTLVGCSGSSSADGSKLSDVTVSGEFGKKPKLTFEPPFTAKKTERKILKEGTGEKVAQGDKVEVNYLGVNGKDGKEFDSSFGKQPVTFSLSQGSLIKGFITGLDGTKVGSRVLVAISPADGYGPAGGEPSAGIGKDDSLLFVIDVVSKPNVLKKAEGEAQKQVPGNPQVAVAANGEATITVPKGPPPTAASTALLIKGKGTPVKTGQTITTNYVVADWVSGKAIESSWKKGRTADMQVGGGQLQPDLEAALVGKPVGSQVLAVVPQPQGLPVPGADPSTATTDGKPNALVFVIDILATS